MQAIVCIVGCSAPTISVVKITDVFHSRRAAKYQPDHRERLRRYAPDTDNAFFDTTNIVAAMRLDAIYFKCNKTLAGTLLLLVRRPTTAIVN